MARALAIAIINIVYYVDMRLTMFPVRLRHAPNNLTEDEYPVHLVFLNWVPRRVALVIRDNQ